MSEVSLIDQLFSADVKRVEAGQEAVQRHVSAWSECKTTRLVDGVLTVVPLSEIYIEWLDQNFPDGP